MPYLLTRTHGKMVAAELAVTGMEGYLLCGGTPPFRAMSPLVLGAAARLIPVRAGTLPGWVLLSSAAHPATVNGARLEPTGIRWLVHRDRIELDDGTVLHYSAERRARVEPYVPAEKPGFCARCKSPMQPGRPAVQCPGCQAWYHDGCWNYAATCLLCPQDTALDAGLQWLPDVPGSPEVMA